MRIKIPVLILPLLLLSSCGKFYMTRQKTGPEIRPGAEKARLVIYRGTSFGGAVKIDNFIDGTFVGQTKGKSYFITDVEPGTRYIIAAAENNACAKITFEPGKVYYLLQAVYPGVMFARTGFSGSDPDKFQKDLPSLKYLVVDAAKGEPKLNPATYKRTIDDHEAQLVKDPLRHKNTSDLQGF